MYSHKRHNRRPRSGFLARHWHLRIPLLLVLFFLLAGFIYFQYVSPTEEGNVNEATEVETTTDEATPTEPQPQVSELPNVQNELDAVLPGLKGEHAVLLEDPETDDVLASHRTDEPYFTASIYKLYVAYLGLIDIESGEVNPDEAYNQGRTRQDCITEMIRDSDSPCAEQMWNEQGKETATSRLESFGFEHTSMEALTTTVHDANLIMKRLQQEEDLGDDSTSLLREALQEQIYREAIPAAVPEATVYNKVGFYETGWLDVAIIELPSGREVVLSIFSDAASHPEVAAITEAIISPLLTE